MYADAQARGASGEIKPVTAPPECERAPGTPTTGDYGVFNCFMPTTEIKRSERNLAGTSATRSARSSTTTRSRTRGAAELIPGEKLVVDAASRRAAPRALPAPAD